MVQQELPSNFICPLTKKIMRRPTTTLWGATFERHAIVQWLAEGNETCPVTSRPLSPRCLVPNNKLQNEIVTWLAKNGGHDNETKNDETDHTESEWKTMSCIMALTSPQAKKLSVRKLFSTAAWALPWKPSCRQMAQQTVRRTQSLSW